jgi:hypothetical protein
VLRNSVGICCVSSLSREQRRNRLNAQNRSLRSRLHHNVVSCRCGDPDCGDALLTSRQQAAASRWQSPRCCRLVPVGTSPSLKLEDVASSRRTVSRGLHPPDYAQLHRLVDLAKRYQRPSALILRAEEPSWAPMPVPPTAPQQSQQQPRRVMCHTFNTIVLCDEY